MINIALASRSENDRKAISAVLAEHDDFHIISIGEDGYDALQSAMTQQPDIIIMDFVMEDIESPDLAPIIKRNSPSTALIVLCSHNEPPLRGGENTIAKALGAGISGYLLRQEGFDNLAASVRSVFYGGLYVSKSVKDYALNCFSPSTRGFSRIISPYSFTHTELGIFHGITCGYTDREIAHNLNMSIGSLRNCINQVKKKTGLHNRTQITVYALLTGIISIRKIKEAFL